MNRPLSAFRKAAKRRDRVTIAWLIRAYPHLHQRATSAGRMLEVLAMEAPELLEHGFQAGLSPNSEPEDSCQTLLQHAAAEGDTERVRLLIRYGVDLERRNRYGEIALAYACTWGQLAVVEMLVGAGADVNAIEENPESGRRNTPLDCTHRHPEIRAYLCSKGAKLLEELEPQAASVEDA